MNKRNKQIILCILVAVCLVLLCWVIWENTALEMNTYCISGENLPDSFDDFTIAHVSDLHNAQMGKDNEKLLQILQNAQPDVIAITGDLVDSRRTDLHIALSFAGEAVKIAPCYYVPGNHESRIGEQYLQLKDALKDLGVIVLENEALQLYRDGDTITLAGVVDPSFYRKYLQSGESTAVQSALDLLPLQENDFTILLSHRPEFFESYVDSGVDLVLCGHAHGGQFRLPFVGGLYAPGQGLFPQYDSGLYTIENTNMVVSRGIGNSAFPLRFNNRPEVIIVTLNVE